MTMLWNYSPDSHYTPGASLNGYRAEATDGHIGKVDEATDEVGAARIVVNCKPWLVGKHVMLPAGTITRIDSDEETVYLALNEEQIKDAPEYNPEADRDDAVYRTTIGTYYGSHVHN